MPPRKKAATSVRSAQEKAKESLSRNTIIARVVGILVVVVILFVLTRPGVMDWMVERSPIHPPETHGGITNGNAALADVFTPQVMYWQEDIVRWAKERNLNPNLIATIIQIESCGDPYVSSGAGAQGLFQVMPLHFQDGENQINPEINSLRGLNHLVDCLNWTDYDVGVTFACYNGGPSVIGLPQSQWYEESRKYYRWGTGIYGEATSGTGESATVQEWLNSGGSILCGQASETQALLRP